MIVSVNIAQDNIKINETFQGANAEEIVSAVKARVVRELPFAMRLIAGGMSSLMFVQELVKQYNASKKTHLPIPNSCAEFLTLAQEQGFAKIEEAS